MLRTHFQLLASAIVAMLLLSTTRIIAQPPPISAANGQLGLSVISGGNTRSGTITFANPTASPLNGANSTYQLFTYGQDGNPNQDLFIESTTSATASFKYWTATTGSPTISGVADNWTNTSSYQWGIVRLESGATASLNVLADDEVPEVYLSLTNQGDLAAYNARLNDILKFDASEFRDAGGNAIDPFLATGFSYTFSEYSGGRYTGIDLVYSPVPEPSFILGAAALCGLGFYRLRRRNSTGAKCDPTVS